MLAGKKEAVTHHIWFKLHYGRSETTPPIANRFLSGMLYVSFLCLDTACDKEHLC